MSRWMGTAHGDCMQGVGADHAGVGTRGTVVLGTAGTAASAVVDVCGQYPLSHAQLTEDERYQGLDHRIGASQVDGPDAVVRTWPPCGRVETSPAVWGTATRGETSPHRCGMNSHLRCRPQADGDGLTWGVPHRWSPHRRLSITSPSHHMAGSAHLPPPGGRWANPSSRTAPPGGVPTTIRVTPTIHNLTKIIECARFTPGRCGSFALRTTGLTTTHAAEDTASI